MLSHEISPLRYPGGKGALAPFFGRLIESQPRRPEVFVEPFAGGAGAALRLLIDEYVDHVVLNDLDPGIAAFWRSVFGRTEDLATLIESAEITVETWQRYRCVYASRRQGGDDLELGFATFFLNRTNRSGILSARPIGGLGQDGLWKIDARFNRANLAERIRTLGRYRNRVTVAEEDGIALVSRFLDLRHFVYADPPYLLRGSDLYLNTLAWADHQRLADLLATGKGRWMVTYDRDLRVRQLYPGARLAEFSIAHTASRQHVGQEFAVFADSIIVPALDGLGRSARFVSGDA